MNNAEYLSLFDTAISLWQIDNGIAITGPEALRFVVVENGCRYFAEAGFPDTLHAGLRLGHLGRSSFRFELALFRNTEERACTEAFFAMVLTDADGRPARLAGSASRGPDHPSSANRVRGLCPQTPEVFSPRRNQRAPVPGFFLVQIPLGVNAAGRGGKAPVHLFHTRTVQALSWKKA
ncbi:acyl-CoA thioesterase [Ponticoccus litoralis]|uniref:Acyl-CoA thioesterase n=1 Tax=Ponticoccus litoralis TaxID=422297 RepID=A0AAW9SPZ1_9RHOB